MRAFLFPGQGAQSAGMGKNLYAQNEKYAETFDAIDNAVSIDLKAACFDGEGLEKSEVTQPAILAHSLALFSAIGQTADIYAGLSLGEYTAMVACGMIEKGACANLVFKRGGMMDAAVPANTGGMMSILGLTIKEVEAILGDAKDVWSANHLSEKQVVLAGRAKVLAKIEQKFTNAGVKVVQLNVSGPFHSPMLNDTAKAFKALAQKANINKPTAIIYSNYTGLPYDTSSDVPDLLANQMCGRVQWYSLTETLIKKGVTEFVEIGPGMVLSKMLKRRLKGADVKISSVRDLKSLNKYLGV